MWSEALAAKQVRLNIGCGLYPLLNWCNIDEDPSVRANLYSHVPPIHCPDNSVDEIYAGHFLEHLDPQEAHEFLIECHRVLKPGAKVAILVPDTREVMLRYVNKVQSRVEFPLGTWRDMTDLNEVCALFLYSTVQASPHKWSYDSSTLKAKLEAAGLTCTAELNRWTDKRIAVGAWYQCGWEAVK